MKYSNDSDGELAHSPREEDHIMYLWQRVLVYPSENSRSEDHDGNIHSSRRDPYVSEVPVSIMFVTLRLCSY